MMKRDFIALEFTDEETHEQILSIVRQKLGSGINAYMNAGSWHELRDIINEDCCQKGDDL